MKGGVQAGARDFGLAAFGVDEAEALEGLTATITVWAEGLSRCGALSKALKRHQVEVEGSLPGIVVGVRSAKAEAKVGA